MLNIKTVLTLVASGVTIVSLSEVLSRWSTFDQLVTAFNSCVLPAGTGLVQLTEGCVCLTVQAETLSALTTLWNLYQDGTLETRMYNFFVTDEIRELAGGEEVEVNVTIEEQEYEKACLELINDAQGNSMLLYIPRSQSAKTFLFPWLKYLAEISADLSISGDYMEIFTTRTELN